MPAPFLIETDWQGCEHGPPEDRETAAMLRIVIGAQVATRVEDGWSGSIHDRVHLSAFPLALWFARSWWRLRWEALPLFGEPAASWRMAHDMPAAGHGFLWPPLRFASDGECIDAVCTPTRPNGPEIIRYLAGFTTIIDANAFEHGIDGFIERVIARMDRRSAAETDLHRLWGEVRAERSDPGVSAWRRIEARLGYDPDEGPATLMEELHDLAAETGDAALDEVASGLARNRPCESLARLRTAVSGPVTDGRITVTRNIGPVPVLHAKPWMRGYALARSARCAWNMPEDRVTDDTLSDLFGISAKILSAKRLPLARPPFGVAVEQGDCRLKTVFWKRNPIGLRFEAARYLADWLLAPQDDHWLPVTDAKTIRQKLQRAFAVEFLCPIRALEGFLDGDLSEDRIEDAALHFGVSERAIRWHLKNAGDLTPESAS